MPSEGLGKRSCAVNWQRCRPGPGAAREPAIPLDRAVRVSAGTPTPGHVPRPRRRQEFKRWLIKPNARLCRLILKPAARFLEIQHCSTCGDTQNAARHFNDRVLNSAMAIRRQQLGKLKQHRATKNDQAHKCNMSGISQAEERTKNCKRGDPFKAWRGGQSRPRLDRRDRRVDDKGEQHPCGDGHESVSHTDFVPDRIALR
jgi:hypothetical protein